MILSCCSRLERMSIRGHTGSTLPVIAENVISILHYGVAREATLGVVPLRRFTRQRARRERIRLGVIVEHRISPSAAVPEPLAVFHHEVDLMYRARHRRCGQRLQ